jgi:hypothetical protein
MAIATIGLALMSFAVVAVAERRVRASELAALRRQGMRVDALRQVSYGGYLMLAAVALILGIATGLALNRLLPPALPTFADGWHDLPPPAVSVGLPTAVTAGVAAAFAIVVAVAGFGLVRAARRRERQASWSD